MSKHIRLALFPMLPSTSAATRAFCERPLPYLAEQGIEAQLFKPSGELPYRLLGRRSGPLRIVSAAVYWYLLVAPRRLAQIARALACDVIFVQRGLFRYTSPPLLECLLWLIGRKLLGRRIVYHCDDALYTIKPRWYRLRFRLADLALTGNRDIARYASGVSGKVGLLDGAVDTRRYPVRSHVPTRPVVIGWVGHSPHLDLPPIMAALAEVSRQRDVIVEVVTDRDFAAPQLGGAFRLRGWRLEAEFSLFRDFDIGIMPLADTEYHRAREAFKIKEYMAAGLPVVCSPVGHSQLVVQHGVTGYFAASTRDWVEYLLRLVDDERLRARLGAAGRSLVEARYDVSQYASTLAGLLRALAMGTTQDFSTHSTKAYLQHVRPLTSGSAQALRCRRRYPDRGRAPS